MICQTNLFNIKYWDTLEVPSTIYLKNDNSLIYIDVEDENVESAAFTIDKKVKFVELCNDKEKGVWFFLELSNDRKDRLVFLAKFFNGKHVFRIYQIDKKYRYINREDALRLGNHWLFKKPKDENNFEPSELRYTSKIKDCLRNSQLITYTMKPQGELVASCAKPLAATSEKESIIIVEYDIADSPWMKTSFPELLILEFQGVIGVYNGDTIQEEEFEIVPHRTIKLINEDSLLTK